MTKPISDPAEAEVLRLLRGLRYGSVEVVIHDGRIVQIERRERLRPHDPQPRSPRAGSGPPRTDDGAAPPQSA